MDGNKFKAVSNGDRSSTRRGLLRLVTVRRLMWQRTNQQNLALTEVPSPHVIVYQVEDPEGSALTPKGLGSR